MRVYKGFNKKNSGKTRKRDIPVREREDLQRREKQNKIHWIPCGGVYPGLPAVVSDRWKEQILPVRSWRKYRRRGWMLDGRIYRADIIKRTDTYGDCNGGNGIYDHTSKEGISVCVKRVAKIWLTRWSIVQEN